MAKGQVRSNREVKKPKKAKEAAVAPMSLSKGVLLNAAAPKKK